MKKHLLLIFVLTMLFGIGARSQSNCNAPTGLTASVHNPLWNNVLLNWNAVADSTQEDLMWSTTTLYTRIGTNSAADFIGTVRFTPTELADLDGLYLTSVTFIPGESQDLCTYSVVVWQGGSQVDDTTFDAGTMIVNQAITTPLVVNSLNTIMLDTIQLIDVSQELWIGIRCVYNTEAHPLGASDNGAVANMGELYYLDGEWGTLTQSELTDYNWIIIGHLQDPDNMVTGYNLYRDNELVSTLHSTSYIDTLEEGSYQYDLTATYFNNCESDPVSVSVNMTPYPCENCQDTVIVGDGTTTTYSIPLNTYYNYSFSEQIYTADELSDISGRINCISFQYIYSTDQVKNIVVYMGNTSKNSFSGSSDWIPVSQMVPVFQGTLNFTNSGEGNWVNIPFNTPFEYDGNSNIVVAVLNNTGSYVTSNNYTFNAHAASGKTLYAQNDSSPYDVNALSSGSTSSNRNNIRFLIGDPVTCPMPGMLTISDITAASATASWHSNDAHNGYELVIVPEGESLEDQTTITAYDTFYVFENLTDNTTYSVYLRAICYDDNSSWVFPVSFTTDPLCTSPENLTVSQIAGASALVSWEPAPVGATAYTVAYSEAGQENWITETVTDIQYMLSGLEPMTTYEVTVTSVCDDGSAPALSKTFTTHCLAGGELQIGEGTSSNSYFPSYSLYNYSYTQQIFQSNELNGASLFSSISFHINSLSTPNRHLAIYLMNTSASSASWLNANTAQQVFNDNVTLTEGWNTFDFTIPFNYDGTNLAVIVIDSTGSWSSSNSWTVHSTSSALSNYIYQDTAPYGISSTPTGGSSSTYRNNIILGGDCDETVTCVAPNAVLSDITSESVTLEWVPGYTESSWEIEYCTDTTNWISEGTVTTSPYTIENLTGNTLYTFRIRSVCGSDDYSTWKTMQTRTECVAISNLPYTENFDSYPASTYSQPSCWTFPITYSNAPYITSNQSSSSPNSLFFNSATSQPTTAVTPPIEAEINTLRVSFMLKAESITSSGTFEVGVMSDPNNTSTFESVYTITPDNTNWNFYSFDLNAIAMTGENNHIAFRQHTNSSSWYYWLDDVMITVIPDCPSPEKTSVTASDIDAHNATISFTDNDPDHDSWTVFYRAANANSEDPWMSEVTYTTSTTLTDLEAETTYDVYVITNCSTPDEITDVTLTIQFTTGIACPAPENLTVTNIGMTSATLSWSSSSESFTIEYGEAGFTPGTGITETVTDSTYDLTGLTSGTNYTIYIKADCDEEGFSSPAVINFSTANCEVADQCAYTFNLSDSYGDGWNGASITVQQNGVTVATVGLTGYVSSGTETVMLCDNQSTVLIWNTGDYDSECSFVVINPLDEVVFATSSTPSGTLTTFTSNCTPPTCPKPTSITVSNIGTSTADVSWVAAGEESAWNLEYKANTDNDWTVIPVTTNTYTLTGLNTLTNYDVRVQADCGDGDLSDYRETSFATASCEAADQCAYTFVLTDSYGDGWNYAYLTVEQNGVTVATLEATDNDDSPSSETVTLNLCDNMSTSLVWHSGNYDSEAGFTLSGPDGSMICEYSSMSAYTTYTFTTDCNGTGPVITDPTVTTNTASAVAQTTATLNATITNPDNVTISAKGFEWKTTMGGTYTQIAGTGTGNDFSANLTGLTPNTGYTYKAFIIYNGTTVYGSEKTFTTLEQGVEPCEVPTGLTASNITKDGFDVSWNANAGVNSWNVRYRIVGGQWTSATAETNQYPVTGLTAETNYEVQVQADCGNSNLSEWSETLNVTTLPDGINSYLLNSIALYPNPAKDVVNVQCTMNNVQCVSVEVFDVYGKVINTVNVVENPTRINVSGLANGMYFVRVTTDAGTVTKSFVKK